MFAKLKKKLAEEAATAPRSGRIPRSMSKESITSVGADSGDDFVSRSFSLYFCVTLSPLLFAISYLHHAFINLSGVWTN